MSRKLASIRRINRLEPIPGKDRIELAFIDGWQVIVKKGEFNVGSKCVYIEIDSVLPPKPEFEFLKSKNYRIKTMKMSGVRSEGICFPMSILPKPEFDYAVDQDVTDIVGVKQYQATMDDGDTGTQSYKQENKKWPWWLMKYKWFRQLVTPKKTRGFPSFVQKTDETRCLFPDTKIDTNIGKVRIADIVNKHLDVLVKSFDSASNEIVFKKIVSYQKYQNNEPSISITYPKSMYHNRTNTLRCTLDHKILSNDYEYKKAEDLHVGNIVYVPEVCYQSDVLPFVYGMLLGDSHLQVENRLTKNGYNSKMVRISFSHGEKQREYLYEKMRLLGCENIRKSKSGYCNNKVFVSHTTVDYTITDALYADDAIRGKKLYVTKEFCKRLTPLSFAILYMDDGTIRHKNDSGSPTIEISTNSFSYDEVQLIIDSLHEYDVDCHIKENHRKEKKYYSIYVSAKGTQKFLEMVTPYMHKSMRYKTLDNFEHFDYLLRDIVFQKKEIIVPSIISRIEHNDVSQHKYVYDLEIEDTHNFVSDNLISHNCQNCPWILENKNTKWDVTEKIDGQSGTFCLVKHKSPILFFKTKYEFIVCSRNNRLGSIPDNTSYWSVAKKYEVEKVLRRIIDSWDWVCIQGECIGPKVQGNKYKRNDYDLYVFNVIFGQGGERFRLPSTKGKVLMEANGLNFVPILETGVTLPDTVDEMLKMAHGQSVIGDTLREGLVCRSTDGKQSFKAVDPEFLMHYDE